MMQAQTIGSTRVLLAGDRDAGIAAQWERRALFTILIVGLVVRLALAWSTRDVDLRIRDEQHYAILAQNLADGHGFPRPPGPTTSLRPPLFPAFVAFVWSLAHSESPTAVRLAQIPLSLGVVFVVFLIGRQLFNARIGLLAAAAVSLYPSLLFSGVLVLSETLFTFLLLLTLLGCIAVIQHPKAWLAFATGAALGAAALTRSVMWPFILVLVPAMALGLSGSLRTRMRVAGVLLLGYVVVVGPWAVRNTRLQGTVTIVDTMGGLNLMMGNYAYTPEDRMWDAISVEGDRAWSATLPAQAPDGRPWTEGSKEKWAQQQAIAYMKAHPGTTARRSLLKLADFWGLEREFLAGVQHGVYSPPTWLFAASAAAIEGAYAVVMIFGVIGLCLARPANLPAHLLLLGLVVFISGLHALTFGHSRYHLPLVPIFALYGAAVVDRRFGQLKWRSRAGAIAVLLLVGLGGIWAREILVRDAAHVAAIARFLGL